MTADHRTALLPLLDHQLGLADSLEQLLLAEHQALLSSDLATLAQLVAEKRMAAETLEQSSLSLQQQTGGEPAAAIQQLGSAALQRWQQLAAVAERLRKQNLHNGALLNERQNRLRWVAQRASGEASPLYAPHAAARLGDGLSGRSLARA